MMVPLRRTLVRYIYYATETLPVISKQVKQWLINKKIIPSCFSSNKATIICINLGHIPLIQPKKPNFWVMFFGYNPKWVVFER